MSFLEQIKALEENRNEETSNTKTIRLYEETKSILARKYDLVKIENILIMKIFVYHII